MNVKALFVISFQHQPSSLPFSSSTNTFELLLLVLDLIPILYTTKFLFKLQYNALFFILLLLFCFIDSYKSFVLIAVLIIDQKCLVFYRELTLKTFSTGQYPSGQSNVLDRLSLWMSLKLLIEFILYQYVSQGQISQLSGFFVFWWLLLFFVELFRYE